MLHESGGRTAEETAFGPLLLLVKSSSSCNSIALFASAVVDLQCTGAEW